MGYIWKLPVQGLYHSSLCRYFNKCRYCFTVQKYKEFPYIILLCLMFYNILINKKGIHFHKQIPLQTYFAEN